MAWPDLTDFQLWFPVTLDNTMLANQIKDKLQDVCTAQEKDESLNPLEPKYTDLFN